MTREEIDDVLRQRDVHLRTCTRCELGPGCKEYERLNTDLDNARRAYFASNPVPQPKCLDHYQTVTLVLNDGRKVTYSGLYQLDPSAPVNDRPIVSRILISHPVKLPEGYALEMSPFGAKP